jgi:hypothetical protein
MAWLAEHIILAFAPEARERWGQEMDETELLILFSLEEAAEDGDLDARSVLDQHAARVLRHRQQAVN